MPKVDEPLLVLHGDADELIPHSQSEALFALHQGQKKYVLIKNGHHNLRGPELTRPELTRQLKSAILRFTQVR